MQRCSRVRASLLLSQPTHLLDTIAETPNAMRMSNSVFKATTTTEEVTQQQQTIDQLQHSNRMGNVTMCTSQVNFIPERQTFL